MKLHSIETGNYFLNNSALKCTSITFKHRNQTFSITYTFEQTVITSDLLLNVQNHFKQYLRTREPITTLEGTEIAYIQYDHIVVENKEFLSCYPQK